MLKLKQNKNIWTRTLCPAKIPFRNKGEIQTFSEEGRQRIVTRRPTLKEEPSEVLETERKQQENKPWNITRKEADSKQKCE